MLFLSKLSTDGLMEFLCAANYLNMPRLIDSGCYYLNILTRGKSVPELRDFLQLASDFTEEEEIQVNQDIIIYSNLKEDDQDQLVDDE